MSFANASGLTVWLGLLGLAAVLFVLQWLRVRHRRVAVVTTLFWREAIEESRARVLIRRFRHPWAYLLALAIASLVWLAWAAPETDEASGVETVFLLDGSAAMSGGRSFEAHVGELEDAVKSMPNRNRRVFWCGGDTRLLLDRDEEALVLRARLEGLEPEASDPQNLDTVSLTLAGELGGRSTRLVLVGRSSMSEAARSLLPENVTVERLEVLGERAAVPENHGIEAIGMAATSSDYEAVDVYVRTATPTPAFHCTLDDAPYDPEIRPLEGGQWLLQGVPARGAVLKLTMFELDELPFDNTATIRLPYRERLRVQLDVSTPEALRRLIQADRALELVETEPDVVIGGTGTDAPAIPALQWGPTSSQEAAFRVVDDGQAEIEVVFAQLGMDQIDATSLAQESGRVVRLEMETGLVRNVRLWDALLTDEFNWTRSVAFPLFIAKSIRWLAGAHSVDPCVSVGEPHAELTLAGASYPPPRVGVYEGVDGRLWNASLSGQLLKGFESEILPNVTTLGDGGRTLDWVTWLILGALVLLGLEWTLYRKGRMP